MAAVSQRLPAPRSFAIADLARRRGIVGIFGLAFAAGLWEIVARLHVVPAAYFPTVEQIATAGVAMVVQGSLLQTDALTLERALAGWVVAVVLGFALAIAAASFRTFRRMISPVVDVLRGIPPAALVPLGIYLLGQGTSLYLTIIVFAALWPIYIGVTAGLDHVDRVLINTGAALGLSSRETLLLIKLPAALPEIFTGLRLAAGFSLMGTVVAEMLSGRDGIGYTIYDAAFSLRVTQTFVALVVIGLDGILINSLLTFARRRATGWHIRLTAARMTGAA